MRVVLVEECAVALTRLMARSGKYPQLVNEAVVALTLLSTHKDGSKPRFTCDEKINLICPLAGLHVLSALMAPLPIETAPAAPEFEKTPTGLDSATVQSPTDHTWPPVPRRGVDMLLSVLKNIDVVKNVPVQIRVNVCTLLHQLTQNSSGGELTQLKETVIPALESLADKPDDGQLALLATNAKKVLELWGRSSAAA